MIIVNRSKAEESTRNHLRNHRSKRLAELDIAFMRAIEKGDDVTDIVNEKQALRDVTDKDLSSLSIEELASLTLEKALVM